VVCHARPPMNSLVFDILNIGRVWSYVVLGGEGSYAARTGLITPHSVLGMKARSERWKGWNLDEVRGVVRVMEVVARAGKIYG